MWAPPYFFFFSSRRRHTRWTGDWSSDVCSSDLMPAAEVDAMLAAGPARRHYNPGLAGVLGLLAELGSRPPLAYFAVSKPGFRLELRGTGSPPAAGERAR